MQGSLGDFLNVSKIVQNGKVGVRELIELSEISLIGIYDAGEIEKVRELIENRIGYFLLNVYYSNRVECMILVKGKNGEVTNAECYSQGMLVSDPGELARIISGKPVRKIGVSEVKPPFITLEKDTNRIDELTRVRLMAYRVVETYNRLVEAVYSGTPFSLSLYYEEIDKYVKKYIAEFEEASRKLGGRSNVTVKNGLREIDEVISQPGREDTPNIIVILRKLLLDISAFTTLSRIQIERVEVY
ncbi:hypothetical protein [Desulfurococcus amylolyticus]|nr:hypothetical protein [Desulfurococcus amylolyticus]